MATKRYILAQTPGVSGFKRWDAKEYFLVEGITAKRYRLDVVGEWLPTDSDVWSVEDGHLPGHQPIVRNSGIEPHLQNGYVLRYIQTVPPRPYAVGSHMEASAS